MLNSLTTTPLGSSSFFAHQKPHPDAILNGIGEWCHKVTLHLSNKLLEKPRQMNVLVPCSFTYNQAATRIADEIMHFHKSVCFQHKKFKPQDLPKKAYMKTACAALRELKEKGIVFRTGSHPLHYHRSAPQDDPGDILEPYWSRDHVFRAACKTILVECGGQTMTWTIIKNRALVLAERVTSALPKFLRRQLAQRKISWIVAHTIFLHDSRCRLNPTSDKYEYHISHDNINWLRNLPRWAFSSHETFITARTMRQTILPKATFKDVKALIAYDKKQTRGRVNLHEMDNLARDLREQIGLRAPKTIKGWLKFHKDYHDPHSTLSRVIQLRRRNGREYKGNVWFWKEMPPLPPLEINIDDETITAMPECTVLWKYEDIQNEGMVMKHCIGNYAGMPNFIAHLELKHGSSHFKASFMVTKRGHDQCYGPRNATNPLSEAARTQWIPLVKEMIRDMEPCTELPDRVKNLIEQEIPRLPRYDY